MKQVRAMARIVLLVLTGFLALTAFAGGAGLLTGLNAPPLDQLAGSLFKDFTLPGLALFIIVGGSALLATIWLVRRSEYAVPCAAVSAIAIMFFEFVEILVIGSPPGIARTLQIFYFGLGMLTAVVSLGIWFVDVSAGRN